MILSWGAHFFLKYLKNANGQYINKPLIVNNKWRAESDEYYKLLLIDTRPVCPLK